MTERLTDAEPSWMQADALLAWADAERKARDAWGEVDRPLGSLDEAQRLQARAARAWAAAIKAFPRLGSPPAAGDFGEYPQSADVTIDYGHLMKAYRDGAVDGAALRPSPAEIERAADGYVKLIAPTLPRRVTTPPAAGEREAGVIACGGHMSEHDKIVVTDFAEQLAFKAALLRRLYDLTLDEAHRVGNAIRGMQLRLAADLLAPAPTGSTAGAETGGEG